MNDINLTYCISVLRKHLFKSSVFGIAILIIGWLAMIVWPRTFASEAKIFIKVGRESVGLDPTATTGQTLMLQKTQEDEVNSALEILTSRGMQEMVVDAITPEVILSGYLPAAEGEDGPQKKMPVPLEKLLDGMSGLVDRLIDVSQVRDPISDRERAIHRMEDMVDVNANRNSTMISVYAKAKSAGLAQKIAKTTTELYLKEHSRIRETPGSLEFFEDTSTELAKTLDQKANEIRAYKQEHLILSIDDNRSALRAGLESTEAALQLTRRECEFTKANIAELAERIDQLPMEVVSSTDTTTWSGMRQRLFELQVEEKRLLSTSSETHPAVVKVRKQRVDLEELLATFEAESGDKTTVQNPIRRQLELELISMQAQLAGHQARLKGLIDQEAEIDGRSRELAKHEVYLSQLERELAILDLAFRDRTGKLNEATISSELDARKIFNISVAQPATYMEKPISPQKVTMLAGTLMAAFLGVIGVPVLVEAMTVGKIKDDPHITKSLNVPIAARIPRVRGLRLGRHQRETVSEECGRILQKIRSSSTAERLGSIGLLSCDEKSTTSGFASQLAIVAGTKYGLSTLLIDGDNKLRTVSKMFRLNGAPGLGELATSDVEIDTCVQSSKYENLMLMTPQSKTKALPRLAHPNDVESLVHRLTDEYDLVIIDLPIDEAAGGNLTKLVDNVFVVADAERTTTEDAADAVNRLHSAEISVTGLVLQGANQRNGS